MLNSGKRYRALRDKNSKCSNSRVVRKKNSERNKKPSTPPLQVKWSVPNSHISWMSTVTSIQSGGVELLVWPSYSSNRF